MTNTLTVADFKQNLAQQYQKTLKFLSAVAYCVQSTPSLLRCDQNSLANAFMKCAEYDLFPSSISGEAYILPY